MEPFRPLILVSLLAPGAPFPASAAAPDALACPPTHAAEYWISRAGGLRSGLNIRKEQEPAFNAFISAALKTSNEVALEVVQVYKDLPGDSDAARAKRETRIKEYFEQQKSKAVAPAFSALAASLSPDQKDATDRNWSWWVPDLLSTSAGECAIDPVSGFTPLMFAASSGDLSRAASLLRTGATVDANCCGRTPLILAAMFAGSNASSMAKLLLDHHAKVDAPDHDGETALLVAAGNNDPDLVSVLPASGADVNHREIHGQTALFAAAGTANSKIGHLLLAKGVDPNARDQDGVTPLMLAVECASSGRCDPRVQAARYLDVAQILVAGGADRRAKDRSGQSALDRLSSSNKNSTLEEMRELLSH